MKTLVKRQSATKRLTARMTVPRTQHAHNSLQRTHDRRCWFLPACVVNPFETGKAPERRSLCNWRESPSDAGCGGGLSRAMRDSR
jgi:hypothetical protein